MRWECVAPRATVIRMLRPAIGHSVEKGFFSRGAGYIEHLQIECAGSQLPFRDLWWGHAHAGSSSLVWIRWGRGQDLWLVYENGINVEAEFGMRLNGDVCIQTQLGVWETEGGQALCDRNLRRSFPRWLVWLTGGMAPVRERKMSGVVRLRTASSKFTGSGIWEEVSWL